MFPYFDADGSVDWDEFFSAQTGANGFRAGSTYQRGSGSVAQFLGKLFTSVVPVLRRMGRSVGREALMTSSKIANDLVEGKNFGDSFKKHGNEGYQNMVDKMVTKLNQKGNGRKTTKRRKSSKKVIKKRSIKKKPIKRKKKVSKRISKKSSGDIFAKWPAS